MHACACAGGVAAVVVAAVYCCASQLEQYSAAAVQLQCMIGRVALLASCVLYCPGSITWLG